MVKMVKEVQKRLDKQSEKSEFLAEWENIKKNKTEMKNTKTDKEKKKKKHQKESMVDWLVQRNRSANWKAD